MHFIPLALYAFLCLAVAIAGRKTRVGGVGLFLLSIIFTPLIVGIVLALIIPRREAIPPRRFSRRKQMN